MDQVVTCPNCSRKLKIRAEYLGRTLACPACQRQFEAAAPPPEPTPPASERPGPEVRTRPASARDYAEEAGLDLDETHDPAVRGTGEADRELKRWKEDLPEAKPAFRPSGKMPPGALAFLSGGALAGAVAGPVSAAAAGALTTLVVWGVYLLINAFGDFCGRIPCVLYVLGFILGLVGYGGSFLLLGFVSAVCTIWAGQQAKNRSPGAASWLSFLSASAGLVVLAVAGYCANEAYLRYPLPKVGQMTWPEFGVAAGIVLGALLAVVAAAATGWEYVQGAKFCEECEAYMDKTDLPGLPLGRLKAVARAVTEKEFGHAADLLDGPRGEDGVAELFRCPGCGRGYLDVHAQFKATWKGSEGDENKTEKWLVASAALTKEEAGLFRPDEQ